MERIEPGFMFNTLQHLLVKWQLYFRAMEGLGILNKYEVIDT